MNAILSALRELPTMVTGKPARESLCFSLLPGSDGGLPRGALTEVSGTPGSGKTEIVLRLLAENPSLRIAWIEEDFTLYPNALPRSRVGLERVLFVEAEPMWTAQQILRSGLFGVVVIRSARAHGETELRRLQIQAERARAAVILMTDEPALRGAQSWPIAVQLGVSRSIEHGGLNLQVLKYRGQRGWELSVG